MRLRSRSTCKLLKDLRGSGASRDTELQPLRADINELTQALRDLVSAARALRPASRAAHSRRPPPPRRNRRGVTRDGLSAPPPETRFFSASIWPGFVDGHHPRLLMVMIFVLSIFMIVQFVLSEEITSQGRRVNHPQRTTQCAVRGPWAGGGTRRCPGKSGGRR